MVRSDGLTGMFGGLVKSKVQSGGRDGTLEKYLLPSLELLGGQRQHTLAAGDLHARDLLAVQFAHEHRPQPPHPGGGGAGPPHLAVQRMSQPYAAVGAVVDGDQVCALGIFESGGST